MKTGLSLSDPAQVPFHVAIFARAPVAGAAKTRLIPLLGPEGAANAQRAMTVRALQTACAASLPAAPDGVSLWTAGDAAHPFFQDCTATYPVTTYPQPEGDLGERMRHCLATLLRRHQRVLLIGTDCPALTPNSLKQSAAAMHDVVQMVFMPAEDGGYVLVGAHAGIDMHSLASAFANIEWSTSRVMSQTRERLAANGWKPERNWAEMPSSWDVDEPADYQRACAAGLLQPPAAREN